MMNSVSLLRSAVVVIWLVVAMTIATELSAPFKNILVQLAGHHWIGKSIIAAVAFALFYFIFRKVDQSRGPWSSVLFVVWSVVLGGLTIFSFFLWHFING